MNIIKKLGTMLIIINKNLKINFCKRSIVFSQKYYSVLYFSSLNLHIIIHYYKYEWTHGFVALIIGLQN